MVQKTIQTKSLEERIIELSYKHHLSHIGSCLTAVRIIDGIYRKKTDDDLFILSQGHAGLALYVVLEKYYGYDAEQLFLQHGVHPNRDIKHNIYASSGSLGHGIGIAVGYAIADKNKDIYCLISDGEMMEGSVLESLRIADTLKLQNLYISVNINGYSAYDSVNTDALIKQLNLYSLDITPYYTSTGLLPIEKLHGLSAHYYTLTEQDYLTLNAYYKQRKRS